MSQSPKRYFGWYVPKPNGTMDLARATQEFSEEDWNEFLRVVSVTWEVRPLIVDYIALEIAFRNLVDMPRSLVETIATPEHVMLLGGVPQIKVLAAAEGALSNFLAGTSALRDRAGTRIRKGFGKDSLEAAKLKAAEKDSYDASFAYRLFYNLRNFAQHEDLPMSTIPVNVRRTEAGTYKAEIRLILHPQELADSERVQKTFREKELKLHTSELDLISLAQEAFSYYSAIVRTVIEFYSDRIAEMQQYGRVIIEKSGMPKDSIPVVWEGDGSPPGHYQHFSFDELGFLVMLYEKLSANGIKLGPQPTV